MANLDDHLRCLQEAYSRYDIGACEEHLRKARAAAPEAAELLRWQALIAYRKADWTDAGDAASRYLQKFPRDSTVAPVAGRALTNLKLWPAAVKAWKHVTDLRPDWLEGWYQLGLSQFHDGRVLAAEQTALHLAALAGENRTGLQLVARLALRRGRPVVALNALRSLASRNVKDVETLFRTFEDRRDARGAYVSMVVLREHASAAADTARLESLGQELLERALEAERQGSLIEAHTEFAALLAVDSMDIIAGSGCTRVMQTLQRQARLAFDEGRFDRAAKACFAILQCDVENARALSMLGRAYVAERAWSDAAEAWRQLLRVAPADRTALLQYARAVERSQEYREIRPAWEAVKAADPDNEEAARSLARLPLLLVRAGREAFKDQRYRDAAEILLEVPAGSAEFEDARRRLEQSGRQLFKEMRNWYKERRFARVLWLGEVAARALPDNADVHRLIAQAAMRTHKFGEAAQAWMRLMDRMPDSRQASAVQLARCWLRLRRMEECRAVLAEILSAEPDNAEARALAAECEAIRAGARSSVP
jgi:tetratricopeptide (TPR) repeat protein